jgi:hypothetical protein
MMLKWFIMNHSRYKVEENLMPIFGSKGKSKQQKEPKKTDKPKKLPDTEMDKVAGGVSHPSAPPPSSDGKIN